MTYPFTAELTVEAYLHGVRIDGFLTKHFRNYSGYRMQRMVRAGQVRIEGMVAEPDDRVFKGQRVSIRLVEPPDHLLPPAQRDLEILYEDPWLIVVNKPYELVVHPCGMYSTGSLVNVLQSHFDQQTGLRGLIRPGVVHRLDRNTSGVIVLVKEHLAHRLLSIGFQTGRVAKTYLAIVHGAMAEERGTVNLPIGQTPGGHTIKMSVARDAVDPRPAKTVWQVLERWGKFSLVSCHPLTGRLHQIRVHMAALGHPVLADEFYSVSPVFREADISGQEEPLQLSVLKSVDPTSAGKSSRPLANQAGSETASSADVEVDEDGADEDPFDEAVREEWSHLAGVLLYRQALHAHKLSFLHPILKQVMTFEAPLPPDMRRTLEAIREYHRSVEENVT